VQHMSFICGGGMNEITKKKEDATIHIIVYVK
jgi:hypothetical protein